MPTHTITWPGVGGIESFSFPFGPGIRPSVCTIYTHAAAVDTIGLAQVGSLFIVGGGRGGITFPDCLLEAPRVPQGKTTRVQLPIVDRRWKWRFGFIEGSYNQRKPDNTLIREKTPQELAQLCLGAMGETGADVSRLPNATRPAKTWVAANPAQELDRLCQALGCLVVLNQMTNKVELWPVGTLRSPSPFDTVTRQIASGGGISVAVRPKDLLLVGGETLIESSFLLEEPVGRDTDGSIKPIDDLSYKPPHGWENEPADLPYFQFEEATYTDPFSGEEKKTRDLALSSVWKMYKIGTLASGSYSTGAITAAEAEYQPETLEDLDIKPFRLQTISNEQGGKVRLPSRVVGRRYVDTMNGKDAEEFAELDVGFRIDQEQGIVQFGAPVYRIDDTNGETIKADLFLETAFTAGKNGKKARYKLRREINPGATAKERVIRRDAFVREYVARYAYSADAPPSFSGFTDTGPSLEAPANAILDAVAQEYVPRESYTQTTQGILYAVPDGVIAQVSWAKNSQGTTTTISAASRHNPYTPTLAEQRRQALVDQQLEEKNEVEA